MCVCGGGSRGMKLHPEKKIFFDGKIKCEEASQNLLTSCYLW